MKTSIWQAIVFAGVLLLPAKILSQDKLDQYIPLPPQELNVNQYLYHIEDVTNLHLVYSEAIIESRRIAIYSDSIVLRELLDTLFTKNEIYYLLRDQNLVLSPQKNIRNLQTHFTISGEIRNAKNDKFIPYATVFLPHESTGTIANYEGRFEISLPIGTKTDSLRISCLGYNSESVSINALLTGDAIIGLKPQKFQIEEIFVRPQDPHQLIQAALENKKKNYPDKAIMLTGFFRETSAQNETYISLSEAIINIYKTDYSSEQNDLIRLIKGRHGSNVGLPELLNLVVEGGLFNNLQLDIMKYGVNFIDPEFFGNYEYKMLKQIDFNNRQTYVINFSFLNNIAMAGFDGLIYLDIESLAIVRVEFSINQESLKYAYSMLIKKTPANFRILPKYGKYEVEYRKYDDKWNLSHVRSEIAFRVRRRKGVENKASSCTFSSASEFVITGESDEDFEKIRYRDAAKPGDILYEQIAETNNGFWGDENIIIPEEPLLKTIQKLKLENMKLDSHYLNTNSD